MAHAEDRLTLLSIEDEQPLMQLTKRMNESFPEIHRFMLSPPAAPSVACKRSVVLVGGGIVGLLTAFYLCLEGFQVTLLEKKSFGAAASGRNGGGILALGRDLHEIPMIRISIDLWEQLNEYGIETRFVRSGHAMVAMNGLESLKLQKARKLYLQAGLDTEWLEPEEAVKKLPDLNPRNFGALFSPADAQGYPFQAVTGLVKKLGALGATLVNHCEVTGFQVSNGTVTGVLTDQGDFHADEVIICAGPWTTELGGLLGAQLPILPRRSQIMVTEIIPTRKIEPFVSGNNLYLRQTHAGNVLFGGGGAWEKTGFDVTSSVEVIKKLSTYLVELFPAFQSLHLIRAFAGTVEITADHRPLLGEVPGFSNLYVSSGYSGHGYGISAFAGRLLAKQLACSAGGQELPIPLWELIASLSPSRFDLR